MGLNVFFVAVFFIQSVCQSLYAPATWAGEEDAKPTNPTQPLPVNVSDGRGRLSDFERRAAANLTDRLIDTSPGSFSAADRVVILEAIEKIAASLTPPTERMAHQVIMKNRTDVLVLEIDRFRNLITTATAETAEKLNAQAARVLRLLIELDLAAAVTDFRSPALIAYETTRRNRSERAENWLENTRNTGYVIGGSGLALTMAMSMVASVVVTAEGHWPNDRDPAVFAQYTGWIQVGALVVLFGSAAINNMYRRQRARSAALTEERRARDPKTVYEDELGLASREIAAALQLTMAIDRRPEIGVMALLKAATKLDTRGLIEDSLLCQVRLNPNGSRALDHDPTPQAN